MSRRVINFPNFIDPGGKIAMHFKLNFLTFVLLQAYIVFPAEQIKSILHSSQRPLPLLLEHLQQEELSAPPGSFLLEGFANSMVSPT